MKVLAFVIKVAASATTWIIFAAGGLLIAFWTVSLASGACREEGLTGRDCDKPEYFIFLFIYLALALLASLASHDLIWRRRQA